MCAPDSTSARRPSPTVGSNATRQQRPFFTDLLEPRSFESKLLRTLHEEIRRCAKTSHPQRKILFDSNPDLAGSSFEHRAYSPPLTPPPHSTQEGAGSVRFVSVPDFSKINRFGSVRFGKISFPARRCSACVFGRVVARSGSVLFLIPRPVPAGSRIKPFGSVRPIRFGSADSVRFLVSSCNCSYDTAVSAALCSGAPRFVVVIV